MASSKLTRAHDTLVKNRADALDLVQDVGVNKTRELLKASADDLNQRIRAQVKANPGTSFTLTQLKTTLAQVTQVTRDLVVNVRDTILEAGEQAAEQATGHTVAYLLAADKAFRGVGTQPLALKEASMFEEATTGVKSSILMRLASSGPPGSEDEEPAKPGVLARYGVATIGEFEQQLQMGLVTRKTWGQMAKAITEQSPFLQGKPAYWAERIVRTECLLGETRVDAAVVRAAFRRWYEGTVAELVTERGRKFTTTPNHPMLTRRGWICSGHLREGDDFVCDAGQEDSSASRHEHKAHGPTSIAEIFDSLSLVGRRQRRLGSQYDFHGDGRQGDVDVACPFRMLRVGVFAAIYEPLAEQFFTPSDSVRMSSFCAKCRRLLSVDEQACLCWGSQRDAGSAQTAFDRRRTEVQCGGDGLGTFSGGVHFRDGLRVDVRSPSGMAVGRELQSRRIRLASHEVFLVDQTPDGCGVRSEDDSYFRARSARDVQFDRVRSIRFREYSGHVYNLETPVGYFNIEGGIYTGNTMGAYGRSAWETTREADQQLGDVVKIWSETFDDRTGSDSYATHGAIRRPEEAFDTWYGPCQFPPDRPNDRAILVTHRISWPIPDYLEWRDDDEIEERWHLEGRKGEPPDRPEMTTVDLEKFGSDQAPALAPSKEPEEAPAPEDEVDDETED